MYHYKSFNILNIENVIWCFANPSTNVVILAINTSNFYYNSKIRCFQFNMIYKYGAFAEAKQLIRMIKCSKYHAQKGQSMNTYKYEYHRYKWILTLVTTDFDCCKRLLCCSRQFLCHHFRSSVSARLFILEAISRLYTVDQPIIRQLCLVF